MRKVITVEQAEALWQSGADVWFRFPNWPTTEMDRSFLSGAGDRYTPTSLHDAYSTGGKWYFLGVGFPIYSVEVE